LKKFPNILFIMADDLGYGDLSVPPFLSNNYVPKNFPCTEGGILTPNLEKMAKKGMIMSNFHSASPVCSPSRVAVMTGLYPWRLDALNAFELGQTDLSQRNGFLPQIPTGAEIFREAGYYTAHSGR
jgi:N-acetylgalactosamine-6-sulfatase